MILILTCEHGGNEIPQEYKDIFKEAGSVLETHRGFDPGALDLFNYLKEIATFSKFSSTSRLLIETNRSLENPELFSEFTTNLPSEEKKKIIEIFYDPYRNSVEEKISALISEGKKVLHLAIHSFTPILKGKVRAADIGILFDPAKVEEAEFAANFKDKILRQDKELNIKFNYPYLGIDDGFTTYLRKKYPEKYLGIELEINQNLSWGNKMETGFKNNILEALQNLL
jgi:predicted N-formylglutamate amidohydrolase